jgi:hypothetical protein
MDEQRYSPAECTRARKEAILGNPDMDKCSTPPIERHNLSVRMGGVRRFTRLMNAFSKMWANYRAALAPYFADYNLSAKVIYTDDKTLITFAKSMDIDAVSSWDLPKLREKQEEMPLQLEGAKAKAVSSEDDV